MIEDAELVRMGVLPAHYPLHVVVQRRHWPGSRHDMRHQIKGSISHNSIRNPTLAGLRACFGRCASGTGHPSRQPHIHLIPIGPNRGGSKSCLRIDHFNRQMRQVFKVAEPRAIIPTVARLACNNRQHSSQMAGTETP